MVDLHETARALFVPGKGILAADESTPTADKRLALYGIPAGPEMRQKDRDLFLATPGIEQYLSGVILYDETLHQKADDGTPFVELLEKKGIMAGIKVDEGLEPFPESPDEFITKGIFGLCERLGAYHNDFHTTFTKWRSEILIDGTRLPSMPMLVENAKRLAVYARDVQETRMVPIVEPEVMFTGTHSRLRAREVIEQALSCVVQALNDHAVDLSGVIIKSSMALSGKESGRTDTPEEVATDTIDAFLASIPAEVAGVVFLSGGQAPDQATENLRAVSRRAREKRVPWPLTFSYARALQEEALAVWQGKEENIPAAREVYLARLKKVSEALAG